MRLGEMLFIIFFGIICLTSIVLASRYIARHVARNVRERHLGELKWARLRHEGHKSKTIVDGKGFVDTAQVRTLIAELSKANILTYHKRGVASFVWLKDPNTGMIDLYVGIDEEHFGNGDIVRRLASGLGCKANLIEGHPEVPTGGIMVAFRHQPNLFEIDSRLNTTGQVSSALSRAWDGIHQGSSAAMVMTIDMMRQSEGQRLEGYLTERNMSRQGRTGVYSGAGSKAMKMVSNAVRVSIAASNSEGSETMSRETLRTGLGAISSFGWKTNVRSVRQISNKFAWLGLVAPTVTALAGWLMDVDPLVWVTMSAVTLGVTVASIALKDWIAPIWFRSRMERGEVVVPSFSWWSIRWRVRAYINTNRIGGGRQEGERSGDVVGRVAMPSVAQVLYFHPEAFIEAISFPPNSSNSTDVTGSSVAEIGLPNNMLGNPDTDIFLGLDGEGQPVFYGINDLNHTVAAFGNPSSGKTNILLTMFVGDVWASMRETNGFEITPIWIETKGEGFYKATEIAQMDPKAIALDCNNPDTEFRIALEGPRLTDGASIRTVMENCTGLVTAMQVAWGSGIGAQAREIADALFRISMLLSPDEWRYLGLDEVIDPDRVNIMDAAYYLTDRDPIYQPAEALLNLHRDLDQDDPRLPYLNRAIGTLSRFVGKKAGRGVSDQRMDAIINKLADLRNAPLMWTPREGVTDIYMKHIIGTGVPFTINLGSYRRRDGSFTALDSKVSNAITQMLHHVLWKYVDSHCGGWDADGRKTLVTFDEAADVASVEDGSPVNTLFDGIKDGRERGYAYRLGVQFPAMLPRNVQHLVLSARTKFWFALLNTEDMRLAVESLTAGDRNARDIVTEAAIRALPPNIGMSVMKREATVTNPFTLHVPIAAHWMQFLTRAGDTYDGVADYLEYLDKQEMGIETDSRIKEVKDVVTNPRRQIGR